MNVFGRSVSALICLSLGAGHAPQFHSRTLSVPIYVTVTDQAGRPIVGLDQADFEVLDNGKALAIKTFSAADSPLTILALTDVSFSMAPFQKQSREASGAAIDALESLDRMRLGSFGSEIAISPLLTSDKQILRRIWNEELWFGPGATPLWSALVAGLNVLGRDDGRRVLVVITDGKSMNDRVTKVDVLKKLYVSDASVYAISLNSNGVGRDLTEIVGSSGGATISLAGASSSDRLAAFMKDLHHQYFLGVDSDATDGQVHTLVVRTRTAGQQVRARRGYVAASSTGGHLDNP